MKSYILPLIAVVLILIASFNMCHKDNVQDRLDELEFLNKALADSLKITRDDDSVTRATISLLQTERTQDFLSLQTKDREVQALQSLVKEYSKSLVAGSSVTRGLIETIAELKKSTGGIIIKSDTVRQDSFIYVYPTYLDTMANKWVKVIGTMGRDTTDFKIKVHNEFAAVVGAHKVGLFHKPIPFVELKLSNPYSTTKELRSYQVSMPPTKRWGIGPSFGYGFSYLEGSIKTTWFAGVTGQYNVVRF